MEITIKDKQYKMKYTIRALFIFEQITDKMFELKTITDEYIFFYSILMANNKDMTITFEELIDVLDESPNIMLEFQEFMKSEFAKQNQFAKKGDSKEKKKKV